MENLWKKESSDSHSDFVRLFAHLDNGHFKQIVQDLQQERLIKNNNVSTKIRLEGNVLFRQNKITEAMDYYNDSLCFAENGTENVSLVYANRASCFMALSMYEEALIDIKLATQANYPGRLMPKLMKRQAECLRLMRVHTQRKQFQPTLSFHQHDHFPCLANALELKKNHKFGRYVEAKEAIDVGKIILVEENFAAVSIGDGRKNCTNCMKMKANFIACLECVDATYCSIDCMNRNHTHRLTCGQFQYIVGSMKLHIQTILIAISLFKNVESLIRFVQMTLNFGKHFIPDSLIDRKSQYQLFLTLHAAHNACEEEDFIFDAYKIYNTIISVSKFSDLFNTLTKRRFLQHLVLHHVLVTARNRFQFDVEGDQIRITDISPMTCMFNHSCAPNVFNHMIYSQAVFITIRPIKQGDQLFVSYLGEETNNSSEYRRNALANNFGFLCECDKCIPHCLLADRATMESDSNFEYLKRTYTTAFNDKVQRTSLKVACIRFLNKYGHLPWSNEMNFVSLCYLKWLFEYLTEA